MPERAHCKSQYTDFLRGWRLPQWSQTPHWSSSLSSSSSSSSCERVTSWHDGPLGERVATRQEGSQTQQGLLAIGMLLLLVLLLFLLLSRFKASNDSTKWQLRCATSPLLGQGPSSSSSSSSSSSFFPAWPKTGFRPAFTRSCSSKRNPTLLHSFVERMSQDLGPPTFCC